MDNAVRMEWIKERLTHSLQPTLLKIIDDSHKHAGHEGAKTGAGHFSIEISSDCFEQTPLLECHRMIYGALESAIPIEIHALKIKVIKS